MPSSQEVLNRFNVPPPFALKKLIEDFKQKRVALASPIIFEFADAELASIILILQDNSTIYLKISNNPIKTIGIIPTYDSVLEYPDIDNIQVIDVSLTPPVKIQKPQPMGMNMGMGQPPMGQMGMSQPPMGQMGMGQPPIGQMGMGQPPMGQMGMGQPPMGMGQMGMGQQMFPQQQQMFGQMGQMQNMGQSLPYPYNQYQPGMFNPPPMGNDLRRQKKK
jgi:hypothetical protein